MEPTESDKSAAESDLAEKPTHIRFLVSKTLAGSVIGKGGSAITEFQANSGAQIQLSRNRGFFPETTSRIVLISGTIKEIVTAVELILGKLHSELQAEDRSDVELRRIKLVVPHSSCGGIIGKGGATIRSFSEDSKAGIQISPLENAYCGLSDRLVTLSGTMEEQMRAIALILTKLTEDDDYSQQVHSPNTSAGLYPLGFQGRNSVRYARCPFGQKQNHKEDDMNSVTIGVSDKHIGMVIGRGGSHVKQISLLTDARIKISGRGDFVSGTTSRKVTISGLQRSIDSAVSIIKDIEFALERRKNGRYKLV